MCSMSMKYAQTTCSADEPFGRGSRLSNSGHIMIESAALHRSRLSDSRAKSSVKALRVLTILLITAIAIDQNVPAGNVFGIVCNRVSVSCLYSLLPRMTGEIGCCSFPRMRVFYCDVPRPRCLGEDVHWRPSPGPDPKDAAIKTSRTHSDTASKTCGARYQNRLLPMR